MNQIKFHSTHTKVFILYGLQPLSLPQKTLPVQVRVGISFISADLAKANLAAALSESEDHDVLLARTKKVCFHLSPTPYMFFPLPLTMGIHPSVLTGFASRLNSLLFYY